MRQALHEWWSGLRYSADWKAVKQGIPNQKKGEPQKIAIFSQSMPQSKALDLMSEYVTEQLRAGIERPSAPALNSRRWKEWRK
eukprot:7979745-Pyramimonas_sp.AAC.1